MKKPSITKNILISLSVQLVSLAVSFITGFVVPKHISEYQYAYWQTYLLYVGYVGVLHFGLLDGIVLRYSQYDYDELDKVRIRSQFKILLYSTSAIAFMGVAVALGLLSGISRVTVIFVAVGAVTKNLITYNSYSFQITNRINQYAVLILAQRIGYGLLVAIFLTLGVDRFEWYCAADLAGDTIGIILARFFNRGMYFGKSLPLHEAFSEWKINVASGVILMMANWSSMLLVGGAKMIVQWRWEELTFGKVSFSFSLTNLFLIFVTAVSVVLFPQLKRMPEDKLPQVYRSIRGTISPMLFAAMIFYFPGCWILERYLPAYSQSLAYLAFLLPIIIYTSKVSLLTNNYLKAYRKEGDMFRVNVVSLVLAFISFLISAYALDSLNAVLICVVLSNMLKSILSEIAVMKEMKISFIEEFIIEAAMTVVFILCASLLERWNACITYAAALAVYFVFHRKDITLIFKQILEKPFRKAG